MTAMPLLVLLFLDKETFLCAWLLVSLLSGAMDMGLGTVRTDICGVECGQEETVGRGGRGGEEKNVWLAMCRYTRTNVRRYNFDETFFFVFFIMVYAHAATNDHVTLTH